MELSLEFIVYVNLMLYGQSNLEPDAPQSLLKGEQQHLPELIMYYKSFAINRKGLSLF